MQKSRVLSSTVLRLRESWSSCLVRYPLLSPSTAKILTFLAAGEMKVNNAALISKGASVHGWPSGHVLDCEEAVDFAQLHGVNCMIEKFPLEKAAEAYEHMLSGKVRFRAVLVMP